MMRLELSGGQEGSEEGSGLGTGEKGRDPQVRAGIVVTVETEATDRERTTGDS